MTFLALRPGAPRERVLSSRRIFRNSTRTRTFKKELKDPCGFGMTSARVVKRCGEPFGSTRHPRAPSTLPVFGFTK